MLKSDNKVGYAAPAQAQGTAQTADSVVLDEDKNATGRVIFHPMEQQDETVPFVKGELQPLEYRDVNFARAFYLQFMAVILIAVFYGSALFGKSANDDGDTATTGDSDSSSSMSTLLAIIMGSLIAAAVGIAGFLTLMMSQTESILKISFFTAPSLLLAFGITLFIVDPDSETNKGDQYDPNEDNLSIGAVVLIQAIIFAVISACVYHAYRRFIPFAVSTLKVASMAVRANRGLYVLTACMPVCLSAWFLLWAVAIGGVFASADTGDSTTDEWNENTNNNGNGPNGLAILILLFAFYWTRYVIINVFHTTTAGTVGAWWFTPLADPALCSMDVLDSLRRSLTYSFGSICFGSLVVAIIQTLEHMAKSARRNRNGAMLACILECLLHLLRRWVEYFNSWAFCYVGLYGYDFLTAGKNVVSLFTNKGWSTFASDRLVFRVLYFANLGVTILSGGAACLVDVVAGPLIPPDDTTTTTTSASSSSFNNNDDGSNDDLSASRWVAFLIGFLLGAMVSHTALFVMESAVRTVIVCFAESPAEFQECHPELCQLMREGWAEAYPEQWAACPIVWATPTTNSGLGSGSPTKVATATVVTSEEGTSLFGDSKDAFAGEKDGLFRD